MSEHLTRVELAFYPEHLNHWLRFGAPDRTEVLDRRRSLAFFKPGEVFGYVRWRANEYGTQDWRFAVIRASAPSLLVSRFPGVAPGGETLLSAVGNTKVKRALLQIDALEAGGFEPAEVSPAYYRHVHNRIAAGEAIRAYSQNQHEAYQASQKVSA